MKESQLHDAFIAWLNKRQIPFRHDRTDKKTVTTLGEPDFLICWMSHCLYIECKVGKNKLSPDQEKRIAYLRKSGNKVVVAYSLEDCIDACHNILCIKDAPRGFDADYREQFREMKKTVAAVGAGQHDFDVMGFCPKCGHNSADFGCPIHCPADVLPVHPVNGNRFIGDLLGKPYVFEGESRAGGTAKMIRAATPQDLAELKRA